MNIAIVYPYLDHAARGDELRWSLRSLKNITGAIVYPVVVGRPPDWYTGANIALTENGSREADVQSKLLSACWSEAVTERFLVVSDDTVFTQPIDVNELLTARCRGGGNYTESDIARIGGAPWQDLRRKTLEECLLREWETRDSSTHWPWAFEKSKFLKLVWEMDSKLGSYLIEVLYRNRFESPFKHDDSGFAYVRGDHSPDYWGKVLAENAVVNWSDAAFDNALRAALAELLPEPSPWEKSGLDVATVQKDGDKVVISNQSCLHLGDVLRFEYSPFSDTLMPVFACAKHGECVLQRINAGNTRRCILCPDRAMTNKVVEITRPRAKQSAPPDQQNGPGKAELQAAAEELFCVHRQEIAYTMQAGSRPCVKRPVTVWNCAKHGECSLRPESCLNGKVRGCSACSDLTPLVQINANENAD
jgi:hypothetical protein